MYLDFKNWVANNENFLYAFLVKITYNRETIKDVVQQTYLNFLNSGKTEFESEHKFKSYLLKIAQNCLYQELIYNRKVITFEDGNFNMLYTNYGKIELENFIKPYLKNWHFEVFKGRIYGLSISQIGKEVNKTSKQVQEVIYRSIIPKLEKLLIEKNNL